MGGDCVRLPRFLLDEVTEANAAFWQQCADQRRWEKERRKRIEERRSEVRNVLSLMPVGRQEVGMDEKKVEKKEEQEEGGGFFWICTEWLKAWADDDNSPCPIDNSALLCAHGLVPRASLPLMKRISPVAWAVLLSQYGGGPSLSQEACCTECLVAEAFATVSSRSYREEKARVRLLVEGNLKGKGLEGAGYYVSKPWLNNWLRRTKGDAPTAADSNPLGGLICPHLGLMPEAGGGEARRAVVSGEVWGWLKRWAEEGRRRRERKRA
ncbi:hypothetical protein CLOM_g501 [Closterium sp. NIES-68]|nr:hypothetical protein CLOM_g501 [Closterium sp. NIES-68]